MQYRNGAANRDANASVVYNIYTRTYVPRVRSFLLPYLDGRVGGFFAPLQKQQQQQSCSLKASFPVIFSSNIVTFSIHTRRIHTRKTTLSCCTHIHINAYAVYVYTQYNNIVITLYIQYMYIIISHTRARSEV